MGARNRIIALFLSALILLSTSSYILAIKTVRANVPDEASGVIANGSAQQLIANQIGIKDEFDTRSSAWSNLTYSNGNHTRLIVGVDFGTLFRLLELEKVVSEHGSTIINTVSISGEVKAVVVEIPLSKVTDFEREVRTIGLASYVEPNMKVQALFTPNDPYWSLQWGPTKVEADSAWNVTVGSHDVLVAVVDTGIDYTHPDLSGNYVPLGYDWVNVDPDPKDDFGHGTHCAGIIGAILNNSIGIAGIAQVKIMAEKVLDSYGGGYWDWVANGIIDAVGKGADIISMSLGGYGDSELLHDAVKYAYDNGVLVVAAAGNDDTNMKSYPGAYEEVVAVAATDQYDNKAWFSNWGDWIDLAAPGVDVYSTMPTYQVTLNGYGYSMNYDRLSGTSMACPHVAGVAALLWSRYGYKARDWIRSWLETTADDLGDSGFDVYYGYGRVNARRAVAQEPPAHELVVYRLVTPPYLEPAAAGVINATILNFGVNNETDLSVHLIANDTEVASATIELLSAGASASVSYEWNSQAEGMFNLTVYVDPISGESDTENNAKSRFVYVGFPIKTFVLHSAGNVLGQSIINWQLLNSEWYQFGKKMIYLDYSTLNKESITYDDLSASDADVLIISCAYDPYMGWEFTDNEIEAIGRYVREGHGLIGTAGTLYDGAPNNNRLAPLFGLSQTVSWTAHSTDLLQLNNKTHAIFAGVPDPLVIPMVGSSVPYDGLWSSNELAGGKYLALGHYQESAMVTYRGLLFISPWLEVIPPYYHHHLQQLYNAITWSHYQKPPHDLAVSLACPQHLSPDETTLLNATVTNIGLNNETDVQLFLLQNGSKIENLSIPVLKSGESAELCHFWSGKKGAYNFTAYAPPVLNEAETLDNVKTANMRVSFPASIGFIETHGESLHNEELKLLYQESGHGVGVIYERLTPEVLANYTILVVGEDWSDNPWLPSETSSIKDFVKAGGGFLAIGDELAPSVQSILASYGITYTGRWADFGVTANLKRSHPTMWGVNAIYSSGAVDSIQLQPPAYWIANNSDNTEVLVAASEVGGKILCLSDDFASDVRSEDNDIMFVNIAEWMNVDREHDLQATIEVPNYMEPDTSVLVNASVENRGLNNESNVRLELIIDGIVAESKLIYDLQVGGSYEISKLWKPTTKGTYNLTASAMPVEGETYLFNNVDVQLVVVALSLIKPAPGQFANYILHQTDLISEQKVFAGLWNFTYSRYISPYQMNVSLWMLASYPGFANQTQAGSIIVNTFTRVVEEGSGVNWGGMYFPGWIETNITVGSSVNILNAAATVVGNRLISVCGLIIDCWELRLVEGGGYSYRFYYDKATGLWIDSVLSMTQTEIDVMLLNTNVPLGFQPEHDLLVQQETPPSIAVGGAALLRATVFNMGLNDEFDVSLEMTIDGNVVNSTTIEVLPKGAWTDISYHWMPTFEGTYNVTSYSPPTTSEINVENNEVSDLVWVSKLATPPLPTDRPALYVDPSTTMHEIGEILTVSVNVFNLTFAYHQDPENPLRMLPLGNLYGLDLQFSWDSQILKYVNHTVTVPIENYPGGTLHGPVVSIVDTIDENGNIPRADPRAKAWFAYASLAPAPPFNNGPNSNMVFQISFRVIGTGISPLELVQTTLADSNGDPILYECIGGFVIVNPSGAAHDVALTAASSFPESLYLGKCVNTTVIARNEGAYEESFSVTVYANSTVVDFRNVSLGVGENATMAFFWNTTGLFIGTYMIRVEAIVQSETDPGDNMCSAGSVRIKMFCDVNGDGVIGILDVVMASTAYASKPGDPNWNSDADVMKPFGLVTICDIVMIASKYGQKT